MATQKIDRNDQHEKENFSTKPSDLNMETNPEKEKLWLRVLLVYGSNQHFVKPITLCQQHRRLATENICNGNERDIKLNEPINLSKACSSDTKSACNKVRYLGLISV